MKERNLSKAVQNLKRNWYFPIAAGFFICLEVRLTLDFVIGLFFTLVITAIFASQTPDLWSFVKKEPLSLRIIALLTTWGFCWRGQLYSYGTWQTIRRLQVLSDRLPIVMDLPLAISIFIAAAAGVFVYLGAVYIWKKLYKIIRSVAFSEKISLAEISVYVFLLILFLRFAASAFLASHAFYDGKFDIIYTSDAPFLDVKSAYLSLTNVENDLRQPLFAVFSAPFMGIPYLVGKITCASTASRAILMNSVQILMLFFSNFMIAKAIRLTPVQRVCFMLLASCTYTQMLFVLMMEQYIVVFFWLSAFFYQACGEETPDRLVLWGAGGTMLTSMICLPLLSDKSPVRDFKGWLTDCVRNGIEFLVLLLAFSRFDVLSTIGSKIDSLRWVTGIKLTFADKLMQYSAFPKHYFFAPKAGVGYVDASCWQMGAISEISLTGVALLLLALVGAVLNRKEKSSRLAACWVAFSAVILLFVGWGTTENGLNLYTLYFGWAFLVLLFQLLKTVADKLRLPALLPVVSAGGALLLAASNIPAIREMLRFAIDYYPAA